MDEQHFQVSVTFNIKAKDRTEAAQKAFALGMPLTFSVKDAAGVAKDVRIDPSENPAVQRAAYQFIDSHGMKPGTLELVATGKGRSAYDVRAKLQDALDYLNAGEINSAKNLITDVLIEDQLAKAGIGQ